MRKTKFEEIIETINKANDEGKLNVFLAIWGITEIKNFYENRTCKNCKYLIKTKRGLLCSNPTNYDYIITDENFGCNRFERKESEQNNQENN